MSCYDWKFSIDMEWKNRGNEKKATPKKNKRILSNERGKKFLEWSGSTSMPMRVMRIMFLQIQKSNEKERKSEQENCYWERKNDYMFTL